MLRREVVLKNVVVTVTILDELLTTRAMPALTRSCNTRNGRSSNRSHRDDLNSIGVEVSLSGILVV